MSRSMVRCQGSSLDSESLPISNFLLSLARVVFVKNCVGGDGAKMVNATDMVMVPMCDEGSGNLGLFSLKNLFKRI